MGKSCKISDFSTFTGTGIGIHAAMPGRCIFIEPSRWGGDRFYIFVLLMKPNSANKDDPSGEWKFTKDPMPAIDIPPWLNYHLPRYGVDLIATEIDWFLNPTSKDMTWQMNYERKYGRPL